MFTSETSVQCPFCGETIEVVIDPSESQQTYVEDCFVCCRPIEFQVVCADGEVASVDVSRS